jgi:hypothetical protein
MYPLPRGTRIEEDDDALLLIWKQGKHKWTIPLNPLTNTPSFRTTSALHTYCTFVVLHEAAEVQYYHWREHVLQIPGCIQLDEEFVAEENIHTNIQKKALSASDRVMSKDITVEASNLLSSEKEKESKTEMQTTRMCPLIFNLNSQLEEDKHVYLSAADDQVELMRCHYCLGHLSFCKLKQLALNGKIPQRLAKVKPPTCPECLFGAMTRVPWKGQ